MKLSTLKTSLCALCLTFGLAAPSQAAIDMFLKIPGIAGDSKIEQGAIDLTDYAMSLNSPRDAASGLATGKRQHKPMTMTMELDLLSDSSAPEVFKACATGKHFTNVVLTARKSGQPENYLKITLKDCIISSYQTTGSAGDNPLYEAPGNAVITPLTQVTVESAQPGMETTVFTYDLKAAKK